MFIAFNFIRQVLDNDTGVYIKTIDRFADIFDRPGDRWASNQPPTASYGPYFTSLPAWAMANIMSSVAGILPNVPGFLAQASGGSISVAPIFDALYPYAWFVSLFLSGLIHWGLTRAFPPKTTTQPPKSISA